MTVTPAPSSPSSYPPAAPATAHLLFQARIRSLRCGNASFVPPHIPPNPNKQQMITFCPHTTPPHPSAPYTLHLPSLTVHRDAVVDVIAKDMGGVGAVDPILHRNPVPSIETRVHIPDYVTVDGRVGRHHEPPEHSTGVTHSFHMAQVR